MANYQVGITISLQLQVYKTYLKYISWILTFYIFVLEKLYISEFTKMSYESFIKYILFINFIWSYIHSSVYNIINMKYLSKLHIFTQCKININTKYTFIIIIYNVHIKKNDNFCDFLKIFRKVDIGLKKCLFTVYFGWI